MQFQKIFFKKHLFSFLQVSSELPIGSSAASTSAIKKKIQAKMAGGGGASPASASQTGVSPVQTVSPEQMAANKAAFLEKVRLSNAACQAGDFSQVLPLTQFFLLAYCMPGGQIDDPSSGKHNSHLFLPATPLSPSWTLEGLFNLTWRHSRALDLPRVLLP